MLKEFKAFLFSGNLIEIGIAFVVGGATAAFIGSFVTNMVSPWLSLLTGGANFASMFMVLKPGKSGASSYASLKAAMDDSAAVFSYGAFVDELIKFIFLMLVVFFIVRAVNKFKNAAPEEAPAISSTDALLTEIRDALKAK
jgi:large conductance mechanosensitive channel